MSSTFYRSFVALISGGIFAVGLGVSGMLNPANVRGFLDILGEWKPALMFVMVGAIAVYAISNLLAQRMQKPVLEKDWSNLPRPGFDFPNVAKLGAVLFGVGWGMAGFCPGPAIVSLPSLNPSVIIFTIAMLAGFYGFALYERMKHNKAH
ncbi:MAG: YeeE/YedE family protein [Betaproteobacteria bacterium]|nr:YeeE/YedE family protein [Betaproteobacteria bacterium]